MGTSRPDGRSQPLLICTADDFGLANAVNEAVEIAHRDGVLTAASLMVTGPAVRDALARARRMPRLRVGLHLVLTEGRPVRPPGQLPHLTDAQGRLRPLDLPTAALYMRSPVARAELADEIAMQIEAFHTTGLSLDHISVHQHAYLHPAIGAVLIDVMRKTGIVQLRVPAEPARLLAAVDPATPAIPRIETACISLLARRARRAGLRFTRAVFGRAWTGAMRASRVVPLVSGLTADAVEIYFHPATGAFPGSVDGYAYADELDSLLDRRLREEILRLGRPTGGYRDLS